MDELCGSKFWDLNTTWYTDNPRFTVCFQKTCLVWIPCVFLWIFLPLEVFYLRRSKTRDIPFNHFNAIKLALISIVGLLQITDIVQNVLHENFQPIIHFFSPFIVFFTFILFFVLTLFNIKRGIRSSGILFTFSFLSVICGIPEFCDVIRTVYSVLIFNEQDLKNISYTLYYVSILTIFLFNCFADENPQRSSRLTLKNDCPKEEASFLSKLFLTWFDPYIWKNHKQPVKNYLWDLDIKDCTKNILLRNGKQYEDIFAQKKISIIGVLMNKYGFDFWWCTFLRTAYEMMAISLYVVFDCLIYSLQANEATWKGYFYVVIFFIIIQLQTCITTKYTESCCRLEIRVKGSTVSCLYEKALRISNGVRKDYTTSDIVNLMSVDTLQLQNSIKPFHLLFAMCVQVIASYYYLWILLGPSVVTNAIIAILVFLTNYRVIERMKKLQIEEIKNKDIRGKFMQEIFAGIKVLKMYAWESSFRKVALHLRADEYETLKNIANKISTIQIISVYVPFVMCFVAYLCYILANDTIMSIRVAFVSFLMFNFLRIQCYHIPFIILLLQQVRISINRINKFLNSEEIDDVAISRDLTVERLIMKNATFSWVSKKGPASLQNLNVKIKDSCLVAVVGSVGSGKSSFISAFLGEMYKISGYVNIRGKIAYVPQQAWILNCSVKDNITLGEAVDQELYEKAIEACALKPDIDKFPAGDFTEIGEKGVNLSGGQKQRISLARAVCQNANIYFFDDPLSAVDSYVANHLFEHVLGPNSILKNKTRVLVTHNTKFFPLMDTIIVLKNGKISQIGKYQELLNQDDDFADFVYSNSSKESNKKRDEHTSVEGAFISLNRKTTQNHSSSQFENKSHKIIDDERVDPKEISAKTYWTYFMAVGKIRSFVSLLLFLFYQTFMILSNLWLSKWITSEDNYENRYFYLSIYAVFGIAQGIFFFLGSIIFFKGGVNAARYFYNTLLHNVLQWPMSTFEATPVGRIMTRFSDDVYIIDNYTALKITGFLYVLNRYVTTVVLAMIVLPITSVLIFPIIALLYVLRAYYGRLSHQLKRIEVIHKSPLYSHLVETVLGIHSIRAYNLQAKFISRFCQKNDTCSAAYHSSVICTRWFCSRSEFLECLLLCLITTIVLLKRDTLNIGIIVLDMVFVIQMTRISFLAETFNDAEETIISVERIHQYLEYPGEYISEKSSVPVPDNWPNNGEIVFQNYKLRYRECLEYVLKGISFTIKSGEKIGIVGRTGAGKSSVILGLFRIVEPADGTIFIDNIDITKLGLQTLRSRLTVIPQDPVLFSGTLRFNLDPFDNHSDEHLWNILEKSHLKTFVSQLPGDLRYTIEEGGQNLSFGQRQLICLARALLRKTKILVLDEATASVDVNTDQLIQQTIRKEFSDCTVIAIAHRLNTLQDYDKILILDGGQIVDFDTVENLMKSENPYFRNMVLESRLINCS